MNASHHQHVHHTTDPPYGTLNHGQDHMIDNGASEHAMHNGTMDHMPDHMMKMYFHVGCQETILFYGWKTTTVGGLVGSCFAIFVLATLYEGLKVLREYLLKKYSVGLKRHTYAQPVHQNGDRLQTVIRTESTIKPRMFSLSHVIQTFLHIVQVVISYFLMLIFMTFNIWLCLSVALGAGFGYFIFGWKKAIIVDTNEHCH